MRKKSVDHVSVFREQAVGLATSAKDFKGKDWRNAFYEVWRWNMTWNFAYSIKLIESRSDGVVLILTIKRAFFDQVFSMLEDLDYSNIHYDFIDVGFVDCCETEAEELYIE